MSNRIFDVNQLKNIKLEGHIINSETDIDKVKYGIVALGQGGGKLAIEFNRIGHYVSLFNTAQEDLSNAEYSLKEFGSNNYKITKFSGFDGAKKDRNIGLRAVHENLSIIQSNLVNDVNLKKVDFVWVLAALGGGTGAGSITDVVKIVSNLIRNENNRLGYLEDDEYIINEGKPTVGVIALLPDNSSGHRVKLNAAEALKELIELQEENMLGNILIVDNEKLIDDALTDTTTNLKWHEKGNAAVVSMLTEVTVTSSIPSQESFDKSELLDIFSEPGFLNFSKYSFDKREQDDLDIISKESVKSQIFADGFNSEEAIISAFLVVRKKNSKLITDRDEIVLKKKISELMQNTRYIHFGIYDAMTTLDYETAIRNIGKHDYSEKDRVITYTLSVMKNPPKRIIEMTKDALDKKNNAESSLSKSTNELNSIELPVKQQTTKKKSELSLSDLIRKSTKSVSNDKNEIKENINDTQKTLSLTELLDLKRG